MAVVRDPLRGRSRPLQTQPDEEIIDRMLELPPERWVTLTGAGMSTDSGIPDYRGPDAAPRSPMTFQTFLSHPAHRSRYWARSWLGWKHMTQAAPNSGHVSLAALNPRGVITQNVDGLHQVAGSEPVIDLHGRLDRVRCLNCGLMLDRDEVQAALDALNPDFIDSLSVSPETLETAPDGDVELEETAGFRVLDCPRCGGIIKPDVVFFGESVPKDRVAEAHALVDSASGLVVLGSSLAVHSGLRYVRAAVKEGRPVVIVTDGPTRADDLGVVRSVSRVADFLSAWQARVEQSTQPPGTVRLEP
ncbi:NAD-dependent protein deacetylase [Brevibacterium daeguense]|uniref:protein acetyllysine N-acetyltransferase n=1 Tax=Brevibacterium daeguense TaxID=909936 RepID=A0ABP8EL14_9MICO|nr:Sir2 family NAD-dependent protein deacetylase [Brevibacterium daeguense]